MPAPTNVTDRIAHLRERKLGSSMVQGADAPLSKEPAPKKRPRPERRFAPDFFMLFVYGLLVIALLSQLALIVWLDVI
ncbi:MAG: hypothetical protein ACNA77_09775 [Opitutales bacterium]